MNYKQLHREYRLYKLGVGNLSPTTKSIFNFLEENLTNLNCYTSKEHPVWKFYGKDKNNIVLGYNQKNGYLGVSRGKIWSFFSDELSIQNIDIQQLMKWYVGNTLKIEVSATISQVDPIPIFVGNTLKIEVSATVGIKTVSPSTIYIKHT